jgi:hypothetical protein
MTDVVASIARYGAVPVLLAVGIYILLRGEVSFHYPRKPDKH